MLFFFRVFQNSYQNQLLLNETAKPPLNTQRIYLQPKFTLKCLSRNNNSIITKLLKSWIFGKIKYVQNYLRVRQYSPFISSHKVPLSLNIDSSDLFIPTNSDLKEGEKIVQLDTSTAIEFPYCLI